MLHTHHVATVSACRGVTSVLLLSGHSDSEGVVWRRDLDADSIMHSVPEGDDLTPSPPATALAYALEEINSGNSACAEACLLQCHLSGRHAVEDVANAASHAIVGGSRGTSQQAGSFR